MCKKSDNQHLLTIDVDVTMLLPADNELPQSVSSSACREGVAVARNHHPRRSILKPTEYSIPVNDKGWIILPKLSRNSAKSNKKKLDLNEDSISTASPSSSSTSRSLRSLTSIADEERSVTFGNLSIRAYNQTVGDNPSAAAGPPIALDWTYCEIDPVSVEDFEAFREKMPRRSESQLITSRQKRFDLLNTEFQISSRELLQAERDAKACQQQRMKSCQVRFAGVRQFIRNVNRNTKTSLGVNKRKPSQIHTVKYI